MTYYSQLGQDKYISELLKKKNGTFLDIGAANGIELSNTKHFEEEGWTGFCIEPNKAIYPELEKNRKCECFNVALGEEGSRDFILVSGEPYMLSGFADCVDIDRIKLECERDGGDYNRIQVPAVPLENLCEKTNIWHFDYCSLDTEGSELEILKSINWKRINIDYISVENNSNDNNVRDWMEDNGFVHLCKLTYDDIYEKH